MDLNALREFAAVISEGSFAAAARHLNTPKSTVSKRIQDLEAALGARLIERSTRKLKLTPEGAVVLGRAERILADANEITQALAREDSAVQGHLRLAAPTLFGQAFLGAVAADCRARYPGMTLEIVLQDGFPDIVSEGFDAAIRVGGLDTGGLDHEVLGRISRVLVAAPGVVDAAPGDPGALTNLPTLLFGHGLIQTWHLTDGRKETAVRVAGGLSISAPAALREAALAGAGIALLPAYAVAGDLAARRLERILPGWTDLPRTISLVYPGAAALTLRLRTFADELRTALEGHIDPAP